MAQTQPAVEKPATESPDVDALLEAKFGRPEEPETQEPEAPTGEEVQAAEETGEQPTEPELVEVDIDGETWSVPPKIKDRIMAERDYTAKTTEVANTRRALEDQQKRVALAQEEYAFVESVAEDMAFLRTLNKHIGEQERVLSQTWGQMTREQRQDTQFDLTQLDRKRSDLANALQAKHQEFNAKLNGERSKIKESAKEILSKAIPNWSEEVRGSVEKYAQSLGYPEIAVQNMSALDAQVAWKAMQYDKLKADTKNAVKKAGEAPVIAPTARKNPMPQRVRAKLELKNAVKAGNRENIATAVEKRLGQLFGG